MERDILNTEVPAVVLDLRAHGAVGIMRSLGRLGVAMYGIDASLNAPASSSRYCRRTFQWNFLAAPRQQSLAFLSQVSRDIGQRPIIVPTSDDATIFVSDNLPVLREWFIYPDQSSELVHMVCSKKQMYYLAKRLGIPTAETRFPQSHEEVLRFVEDVSFPVVLKAIDGSMLNRRTGKKMVIVNGKNELLHWYEALDDPAAPNLMLQEYIPGGDDTIWMFNGYFDSQSDCRAAFTGRKIRQRPIHMGITSLGICQSNPIVEATTKEFMKKIGYRGTLDIGYRYDARDGQYKVLDINPRIGATFRLFVDVSGMDVARIMYLDLTGQQIAPVVPRWGRKWMVEFSDIASCLDYRREGTLTLRKWIASYRGLQEGAYFALDDPVPFVRQCTTSLRKRLGLVRSSKAVRAGHGGHAVSDKEKALAKIS